MGRPQDKFAWEHAEKLHPGWKCKYCSVKYQGSASRVRNHLSGAGGNISPCEKVPKRIQKEASRIIRKKTVERSVSIGEDSDDGVDAADPSEEIIRNTASASIDLSSFLENSFHSSSNNELVIDPLVKFMCKKFPFGRDSFKHRDLMEFFRNLEQHGVRLQGHPLPIERSLWNIEQEVRLHMGAVKESWKTTGCTLIELNLHQKKANDRRILGFYCPKGIIFAQAPDVLSVESISQALKGLLPGSDIGNVTHFITHQEYPWSAVKKVCESSGSKCNNGICGTSYWERVSCARHEIKLRCMEICFKSDWVRALIDKAKEIRQDIVEFNLCSWYYQTLDSKGLEEFAGGELENPLSRFLSIILLENDLKQRLSEPDFLDIDQAKAIIADSGFWAEGRDLKLTLSPLLKIPRLMDTLVPTAGYIEMLLTEARRMILRYDQRPRKHDLFWNHLDDYLDNLVNFDPIAAYLNPSFIWSEDEQEINKVKRIVEVRLRILFLSREREYEQICKELQIYSNRKTSPFGLSYLSLKDLHPVIWWEQSGHSLPHLQKLALQLLSQPVCCLCNQIQKHISACEGEDDFILKLNLRVMEEFASMGGNIYKPINFNEIHKR